MERIALLVVTAASALAPFVVSGGRAAAVAGPLVVGVAGLVLNWKTSRRAAREEARAVRAEERAEAAEERSLAAEGREREAHEWDRERWARDEAALQAARQAMEWVSEKKRAHGTAWFQVDVASELNVARAAERQGLLELKELAGGAGVISAEARLT